MDPEVDHYRVLGLPSGGEGAKLTDKEISKAYKLKALELHPDKRRDDPDADANFQKLKSSYEILKDKKAREQFDDLLRIKREKQHRETQYGAKRRKMMSDLEKREKSASELDPEEKAREDEGRMKRKLQEEIARVRAMQANKGAGASSYENNDRTGRSRESVGATWIPRLDKEKVLNVSWEKVGGNYTAERLREIFGKFGEVEDVVIMSSKKKKGKALIVMKTKDSVVAACGSVSGDLSNPLLVLPLSHASVESFPSAKKPMSHAVKSSLLVKKQVQTLSLLQELILVRQSPLMKNCREHRHLLMLEQTLVIDALASKEEMEAFCKTAPPVPKMVKPREEVWFCVVNVRWKVNPPLPSGYYGNAMVMLTAVSIAGKLTGNGLDYAMELIKNAKAKATQGQPLITVPGIRMTSDNT